MTCVSYQNRNIKKTEEKENREEPCSSILTSRLFKDSSSNDSSYEPLVGSSIFFNHFFHNHFLQWFHISILQYPKKWIIKGFI